MLYTIVKKHSGKEVYATYDIENIAVDEIAIPELRQEEMENPYFNFETREFYNKI
jgi:hypothetical protein